MPDHLGTGRIAPQDPCVERFGRNVSRGPDAVHAVRRTIHHGVFDASGLEQLKALYGSMVQLWSDLVRAPRLHGPTGSACHSLGSGEREVAPFLNSEQLHDAARRKPAEVNG